MKAWITGARGFIGRHLAHRLAKQGNDVAGLGHGAWTVDDHRAWGVHEWRNGDIAHANLDALAKTFGLPDVIFHLAGGSAVGASFQQPAEDFQRSVVSVGELVEWLRLRAPSARLVMASSAAVYGSGHAGPIAEATPCTPYSPYGFHKRMAELSIESYARNFGLRAAIVRLFSVYGSGARKQLLWDACTQLARASRPLQLGGSGLERRDWLHVSDAARLLDCAADWATEDVPILNGGTGIATTIADIAGHLCDCWGDGTAVRFTGQSRAGDPHSLVADPSQLAERTFAAEVEWRDGLREYIAWYRRQLNAMPPDAPRPTTE